MEASDDITDVGLPESSISDEPYADPRSDLKELIIVKSEAFNAGSSVALEQVTPDDIGEALDSICVSLENPQSDNDYNVCNEEISSQFEIEHVVDQGLKTDAGKVSEDVVNEVVVTNKDVEIGSEIVENKIVNYTSGVVDLNEDQEPVVLHQDREASNGLQQILPSVSERSQENVYIFTCPFCLVRFKEAEELKTHLMVHVEVLTSDVKKRANAEHVCGECKMAFDKVELLESHLELHKPKVEFKIFKCDYCGMEFHKQSALNYHLADHKLDNYQCTECKKYFMNEGSLQNHKMEHVQVLAVDNEVKPTTSSDKITTDISDTAPNELSLATGGQNGVKKDKHRCTYCEKTFKDQAKLVIHLRMHTGEKPFSCKKCPKQFSQKHSLTCHERIHSGERPYECTVCNKNFTHSSSYAQHLRIHSGERPYNCLHCGLKFITSTALKVHQYSHSDTRSHKCMLCPKTFKTKRHLNQHMRKTHSNKNRHECNKCGETFSTKTRLASHQFMHESGQASVLLVTKEPVHSSEGTSDREERTEFSKTGIDKGTRHDDDNVSRKSTFRIGRRLKCAFCVKVFKKPCLLMRHQRIHTGEKPYVCEFCPKAFARKDGLVLHERSHTGEKPYECPDCEKCYRSLSGLKDHEKSHFSCSICRLKFGSKSAVKGHENTQHITFQCSQCPMAFKSKRLLNLHEKMHKDDKTMFECDRCGKVLDTEALLMAHELSHDSELTSRPSKLLKTKDLENLTDSAKEDRKFFEINAINTDDTNVDRKDIENLQCKYCNKVLGTTDQFKVHTNDHVIVKTKGKQTHRCGFCRKVFKKECRRITHERIHTGEKPFKCQTCPKAFARKDGLKLHESTHSKTLPFSCPICSKTFKQRTSLNTHKKGHFVGGLYLCPDCDKSFKSAQSLREHELVHTSSIICSGRIKVYVCQYCQQSFKRLKPFAKHLKSHGKNDLVKGDEKSIETDEHKYYKQEDDKSNYNQEKEENAQESDVLETEEGNYYQCNYCDKKKRTITSIEMHERTHTEVASHSCPICAKRFVREDALKLHKIAKHKQNKVFPCVVCGKMCRSESSLNFHMKSHVKKSFACPVCGEKFTNRLVLRTHKKTHSTNVLRNYYCNECPKSFGHQKSLADHIETCHQDSTRIKCEHCGETFVNVGWLKKHMFKSHYEILVGAQKKIESQNMPDIAINVELPLELQPNHLSESEHGTEKGNFVSLTIQSTVDCIKTLAAFSTLQATALSHLSSKSDDHHGGDVHGDGDGDVGNDAVEKPLDEDANATSAFTNDITMDLKELASKSEDHNETESNTNITTVKEMPQVDEAPCGIALEESTKTTQPEHKVKVFKCRWCPRTYRKPSQLIIHERIHTGEKPFLCKQCGRGFRMSSGLKAHEERHLGVKKFKCTECPKEYASASALQDHLDAHQGIKRYQCENCPKSFRQQQSLREHIDIHKGFRKYQCSDCHRSFSQRRSWRMHMKIHGKIVQLKT